MREGAPKPAVLGWLLLAAVLGWLVLSARWLRSRLTYIPESRVLALMDALGAAGVSAWAAGGWGVDALIGHQTRRHYDLGLVVSDTPGNLERTGQVLARAGFRPGVREVNPGLAMPLRHRWQDDDGHTVEVMPVALGTPPFAGPEPLFTGGRLGGHPVPCLSARLQVTLHEGHEARVADVADMEALLTHVNQAGWAPPR